MLTDCKQTAELMTEAQTCPETVIGFLFLQQLTNFINFISTIERVLPVRMLFFSLIEQAQVQQNLRYFLFFF